jgi:hypothetical protein
MRNSRQTSIRRALLTALDQVQGFLLPDALLRTEASRLVTGGRPTMAEFDREIAEADKGRLIIGVTGEDTMKWKITESGSLWLAENP